MVIICKIIKMNFVNLQLGLTIFLKMDTMSMPASRGASAFGGTRPTSPHATGNPQQQQQNPAAGYSHPVRQQQLQQQLLQQQYQGR